MPTDLLEHNLQPHNNVSEPWNTKDALAPELLHKIDAYWRAANYVSVGQIYLYDNPLLKEPLTLAHVKPLVVGHWGTTPGQNFIYVHLNRVIKKYDLNMFYVAGPGHGGPAIVGNGLLWKAPGAKFIRTSHGTKLRPLRSCSNSSRFPVGSPATSRRRRLAPSTKAASWGTR